MEDFTLEEVIAAVTKVKGKMSSGIDNIPLKLAKLYGLAHPHDYLDLFNHILHTGFPKVWKTARIVPVPKKGDLTEVKNYRPVSNLCSLSKIFERCIHARLTKLDVYNQLIGNHQHGFREFHSTTTCLMTLRDYIANAIDKGNHAVLYSLDLTAAFDMLRIDTFYNKFKNVIPDGLLKIIDFLTYRSYYVNVGKAKSTEIPVEKGCPQGSVLGPVLFNMYVGECLLGLKECSFVSYADDTYVLNESPNLDDAITKTQENINRHMANLREVGMVVNQSKTEIVVFSRNGDHEKSKIVLNDGTILESKNSIKALGVWFDHRLKWDTHIKDLRKRIIRIINGLKIIRRKLTFKQAITIVTSQALSILYYACPAWLSPSIGKSEMKDLESIHFKALRVVVCDYRQRLSRDTISTRTNRLPPRLWCQFSAATILIKMWQNNQPQDLKCSAFVNTYKKTRYPGLLFGFDSSNYKIGKQITSNWCGKVLSQIKVPWSDSVLSKDRIRTVLKSTFYPFSFLVFNF